MSKRIKENLCEGPILKKMIFFTVPIMLATMLQLLFVSVDKIVLGKFVGDHAMGAVGATTSLINLIINVFNGLSIGVAIAVAQYYGAKNEKAVSEIVHTSVFAGLVCGAIVMVIGVGFSGLMLKLMKTPGDILTQATLYLKIYFIGAPLSMLYNYCSAALRSAGDTVRPMIILIASGFVNLLLNLFFVISLKMGIAGVAWATVISQGMSAVLVMIILLRTDDCLKFSLKTFKVSGRRFLEIIRLGLPAGIQNFIFSIANVTIQAGVNSFGEVGTAGNTAASDLEGYMCAVINAFFNTTLTFVGQNVGGKKYDRINKIFRTCFLSAMTVCVAVTGFVYIFRYQLLSLFTDSKEVIDFGIYKINILCLSYFTYGAMQVFIGAIRGLGVTLTPMFISLFGICLLRMIWLWTAFSFFHTPYVLYSCYPVSWVATAIMQGVCYFIVKHRFIKKTKTEAMASAE